MKSKTLFCGVFILLFTLVLIFGLCNIDVAFADYSALDKVFEINSEEEFFTFYDFAVSNKLSFLGKTIRLHTDVDAEKLDMAKGQFATFYGNFEGFGHTIYNLKSQLFSDIASSGKVKNLNFANASVHGYGLAKTNEGLISDVNISGQVKVVYEDGSFQASGLVAENSGSIKNCFVFCNIISTSDQKGTFSGISNKNIGSISNTVFGGSFDLVLTGDVASLMAGISYQNSGTISDCAVFADYKGNTNTELEHAMYAIAGGRGNVTATTALINNFVNNPVFVSNCTVNDILAVVFDGVMTKYTDTDGSILQDNSADLVSPVNKFLSGEGTINNPYLLSDFADLYMLKYAEIFGNFYYKLSADINLRGRSVISTFANFTYNGAKINGGEFAFINGENSTVFTQEYDIVGENILFFGDTETLSGQESTDTIWNPTATENVLPSELQGSGTLVDPYLVDSAESLKALDGVEGYAIVVNDIAINNYNPSAKKLAINELKVNLNGNGKTIVGLHEETISQVVSGRIYNLNLRGEGISVCDSNTGEISSVTVAGTGNNGLAYLNSGTIKECAVYGEFSKAFVTINNGSIEKTVNYASAEEVFGYSGNGTTTYCINYQQSAQSGTALSAVEYCLDFGANAGYYKSSNKFPAVDYLTLKEVGFDFDNVLGYKIGENLPSVRKFNGVYKRETNLFVGEFVLLSRYYNENISYDLTATNRAITNQNDGIYENTEYYWTYEGEELLSAIKNAGQYRLEAVFGGTDLYLPKKDSLSFVIEKAEGAVAPQFVINEFSDMQYTYTGEEVVLPTPPPDNADILESMGYTQSFEISYGDTLLSGIINAGNYVYTTVFVSRNYQDVSISIDITIAKKELIVKVNNANCDYGSDYDLNNAEVSIVSGLVNRDRGQSVATLTLEYGANCFATNYKKGDSVGDYELSFSGSADNYFYTVSSGVLTVNRIAVPMDKISFFKATSAQNGEYSVAYSGQEVVLTAECDSEVYVVYENNSHINAGKHIVTATFYIDDNYLPRVLRVDLIITKLTLNVVAPSKTVAYGEDFELFAQEITGFAEGESFEKVFDTELTFACFDKDSEEVNIFNAGSYTVKANSLPEVTNYAVEYVDGILVVEKISLKNIIDPSVDNIDTVFKNGEKVYDGDSVNIYIDFFDEDEVEATVTIIKDGEEVADIVDSGFYTISALVQPKNALAINYFDTTYQCTYNVKKKTYSLQFGKTKYEFVYDKTVKVESDFDYVGLPEGALVEFVVVKNGTITELLHAGEYDVSIVFGETKNENSCTASTKVVIEKREVGVEIKSSYEYIGMAITPEILSIDGDIDDELSADDFLFGYRYSSGTTVAEVRNAGDYFVDVSILNTDYKLKNTVFTVTVNKVCVPLTIGTVSFTYGTLGDVVIGGKNYTITENTVTVRGYVYSEQNFDITVRINKNANTYVISDNEVADSTNYDFVPEGKNEIEITKRELTTTWRVDGQEMQNYSYQAVYMGRSQDTRFSFTVNNLCFGDKQSDLNLQKSVSGADNTIYNVGEYYLRVNLFDSNNYTLSNNTFTVNVVKTELSFYINDIEIEQWETYSLSYSCMGLVGDDQGKNLSTLKGARIGIVTSYNTSTPVGSVCPVTLNASFDNYEVIIAHNGKITVLPNKYPDYLTAPYFQDVTYIYTGQNITVEIVGLSTDVTASYSNNVQIYAGTYTVGATVTYPSGRQASKTCRLTILPASPIVAVQDSEMLYSEDYTLSEEDLKGVATFNGNEIEGRFIPDANQVLQIGSAEYNYTFIPLDGKNFNSVKGTFNLRTATVGLSDFTFDDIEDMLFESDGKITIFNDVKMTVNEVLPGLKLYRNGSEVEYINLYRTENIVVSVKSGSRVAFEMEFFVVREEKSVSVVIDESILYLDNITISNRIIYVGEMGGRLSIDDKYKNSLALYINGDYYEELILNGDEGEIALAVKFINNDNTAFSGFYNVQLAPEEVVEKNNKTLWYIIGLSVLGVVAVVAVILIIWKKRNG